MNPPGQARLFANYVPRLMFILLPVFALILKAAFRQRLYFDHLIYALHIHSALFIMIGYMALVAGVFEAASQFTMPESVWF